MREWLTYGVSGACTSFGVAMAARGTSLTGHFYGCCVLIMLFGLWFFNEELAKT